MSATALLISTARLTIWLALLALLFGGVERLFGRQRGSPRGRSLAGDLGYFYLNGLLPTLLMAAPLGLLAALVRAATPAAYARAVAGLPVWAAVAIGLVVAELGAYAVHRLCHRSAFLWTFHKVHHAPERMDWLVNTRAHPIDVILTRLGGLVPLYLLGLDAAGHLPGLAPVLVTLLGTFWSFLVHADVAWRFGWLEQLVATPAFHHWHHTNDEHRDRNFAAVLPAIDRLFGTLHLPDRYPHVYGIDRPGQAAPAATPEPPPVAEDRGARASVSG